MLWKKDWLTQVRQTERDLWRGVEAQHRVATMRLVDDLGEQELLEQLLEDSKPRHSSTAGEKHYLLSTPFRYVSAWPSRFRMPNHPGAWYGADAPSTVAAETAYWRWRFFMDSEGLREEQVMSELTFFLARFTGTELDITVPPWNRHRDTWRNPDDYGACHELAGQVRALVPPVQSIRYESARIEGSTCQVVFDVQSLYIMNPGHQQTWVCKTTRERVMLSHDSDILQFDMK